MAHSQGTVFKPEIKPTYLYVNCSITFNHLVAILAISVVLKSFYRWSRIITQQLQILPGFLAGPRPIPSLLQYGMQAFAGELQ